MRSVKHLAALVAIVSAGPAFAEPVTNPDEAPPAFQFVGEYVGELYVRDGGAWRSKRIGLQVVARGDGRFEGIEYLGGLPGDGWNRQDRAVLPGTLTGEDVTLRAVPVDLVVDGISARAGHPWKTRVFGTLTRIRRTSPTLGMRPPAEADVLFRNGRANGLDNAEITDRGFLTAGTATAEPYSDFTLHVEFRVPFMAASRNQGRGNSGVYLQRRYEIQILDSFGDEPTDNGAGAIYRTRPADVNMAFPPLAWQTYDIRFHPARFQEGQKDAPARVTVWHNGVVIHKEVAIPNETGHGRPEGPDPLPILFQDHNNPVQFRNIWLVDHARHPDVVATPRIVASDPAP